MAEQLDAKRLLGKWELVASEQFGRADEREKTVVTFSPHGTMLWQVGQGRRKRVYRARFYAHPQISPSQVGWYAEEPWVTYQRGIYRLDGGALQICVIAEMNGRIPPTPDSFTTSPDDKVVRGLFLFTPLPSE